MNNLFNSPVTKKVFGIASVVFAGIAAAMTALSDQHREQEFEAMKKALEDLQNK